MESINNNRSNESPRITADTDVEQGITQSTQHESAVDAIVGDSTKQSGKRLRNICIVALTLFVAFGCVFGLYKWCKLSNIKPAHKNTRLDKSEVLSQSDAQNIPVLSLLVLGKTEQDRRKLFDVLSVAQLSPTHELPTGMKIYCTSIELNAKNISYQLNIFYYSNPDNFESLTSALIAVHAPVIMYDISDSNSFNYAKTCASKIQQLTDKKPIVFLVAYKSNQESKRTISYEEGAKLATQNGWKFYDTTGDKAMSIESIRETILSDLYVHYFEPSATQE